MSRVPPKWECRDEVESCNFCRSDARRDLRESWPEAPIRDVVVVRMTLVIAFFLSTMLIGADRDGALASQSSQRATSDGSCLVVVSCQNQTRTKKLRAK